MKFWVNWVAGSGMPWPMLRTSTGIACRPLTAQDSRLMSRWWTGHPSYNLHLLDVRPTGTSTAKCTDHFRPSTTTHLAKSDSIPHSSDHQETTSTGMLVTNVSCRPAAFAHVHSTADTQHLQRGCKDGWAQQG